RSRLQRILLLILAEGRRSRSRLQRILLLILAEGRRSWLASDLPGTGSKSGRLGVSGVRE
ncbi:hypothetical protein, partial [Pseudomonas sp.]|uniref:hypothetical protein n=1 Tax=Pseudomonas sp. TaxID=306 RepID=UPI0028A60DDC